ncbi:hypothetical protein, partial [uncultured Faecalibaculum sp.]|uniref:hypothetical protein n=1 Tax=uncultured Faecalibaculum sp. TaxID=1729681 RepID=UPI0026749D96
MNTDYVAGILKSDTVSPPVDTGKNLSSWVFVRNKAERIHQSSPFFAPYVPVRPVCVQPRKKGALNFDEVPTLTSNSFGR